MNALRKQNASLRRIIIALALACGLSAILPPGAHAASLLKQGASLPSAAVVQEEMVFGFIVKPHHKRGAKLGAALKKNDASALSYKSKLPMVVARRMSDDAHVVRVEEPIPLSEAKIIAARMMRDGEVELAEPDRIIHPATTVPLDPSYGYYQWHYKTPTGTNLGGANLPPAWDYASGSGVTVAVLDTGYRPHADFAANLLPGYDFITNTTTSNDGSRRDADATDPGDWVAANTCGSNAASDSSWHGTHVIGTIGALMSNGKGGTGVAPNVKILPLRVLGKCGGATSDIVDAMRWAAGIAVPGVPANPNPARVLNLSLGGSGACSPSFQSAVNDVVNAGKLIVVSAGNDASTTVSQPANCNGVVAVTAHAVDGDNAHYSNIGSEVFISAPGGGCGTMSVGPSCTDFGSTIGAGVYSTGNTGKTTPGGDTYTLMMGTSMAAPHVAGTIALMLSRNPYLTAAEVKSYLRSSSREHPPGSACTLPLNVDKCGSGLLDAGAALTMVATGALYPTANIVNPAQVAAPHGTVELAGSAISTASSTNSGSFTYLWTASSSNPEAVTLINANQAIASFLAPETGGLYAFKLEVTDGDGHVGRATATVMVNNAPELTGIPDQSVEAGEPLRFQLSGNDADGNPLIFHALSLPDGASISADGTFKWPSATPAGTHEVSYYASDTYSDSSQGTVTIHVAPSSGGGGGGSMDDWSLIGLVLMSFYLRMRRTAQAANELR
jgi:serine protease